MTTDDGGNPYRATGARLNDVPTASPEHKYLAHGIYLQLFIGAGSLFADSLAGDNGTIHSHPYVTGGLLIGLGLNSLIYIRRYKRSLG